MKWISYEEWKSLKDFQRKKEMEILPPWMIWYLYNQTVMDIESKIDMTKFLTKEPIIKVSEKYEWFIQKESEKK